MKYINTFSEEIPVSQVALGCMRIKDMTEYQMDEWLDTALECGINYFDHADIYGGGKCEEVFGGALERRPELRDKILLQSKCGIRQGMYDFSAEHIIGSVEASLKRLKAEYLDVLLLHRPDLLMEPEEVAEAFSLLEKQGKVRHFGVSNFSPMQIELLQKSVKQRLCINQMRLSIANATMVSSGAAVNMCTADGTNYDGYLRDYCRLHNITLQPWSPLQQGFIKSCFLSEESFSEVNGLLGELGEKYGTDKAGMAIAWLLRLPERVQPIVGTTRPERIRTIAAAADIELSREDWYSIYRKAGYALP